MPEPVGQVLVEGSAAGDVQDLHPTADAEQRDPALERLPRQRDLEVVTIGIGPDGLRMRLSPLALGVDVGAASEHQRVETIEQLAGSSVARRSGGSIATIPPAPWIARA